MATAAWPYRRRDYFFTAAERSFYEVLIRAAGEDFRVFAKVRLLDMLWVPRRARVSWTHHNRVAQKHLDFVLCAGPELTPVLALELDDASHAEPAQAKRDAAKDDVLRAVGLPLLRVRARAAYNRAELAVELRRLALPASPRARSAAASPIAAAPHPARHSPFHEASS
jgi:very-short-patch-repair endonuclease